MSVMREHRRIAFAGDWHADTAWISRAVEYAAEHEADCIVHLGDYGWQFQSHFVRTVEGLLRKVNIPVYFVDGNHEMFPKLFKFPLQPDGLRKISARVFHLPRGYRWEWSGVQFMACGGGVSVDKHRRREGFTWWPQEQITADDIRACERRGHTDVLVSHDCPAGVDIPDLHKTAHWFPENAIRESEAHRAKLLAVANATTPRLILHGHYDRCYRAETDLGYGKVRVFGLDKNRNVYDPVRDNVLVLDIEEVARLAQVTTR